MVDRHLRTCPTKCRLLLSLVRFSPTTAKRPSLWRALSTGGQRRQDFRGVMAISPLRHLTRSANLAARHRPAQKAIGLHTVASRGDTLLVLRPEKLQRHVLAAQLAVDVRIVDRRP